MALAPNSAAGNGEHESEESMQNPADMTASVQNLLVQMQTRFQTAYERIISKNILCGCFTCSKLASVLHFTNSFSCPIPDEMGSRIVVLEQSIEDLKADMEAEVPVKKPEESKPVDDSS